MNFKLWLGLLAALLIPSVYTTLRVFFLNTAPDASNLSIAAQSAWLGLIYEVIAEAVLVPLYFIFGQVVTQKTLLRQRVSTALLCSFLLYTVATLGLWLFTDHLIQTMQQQPSERLIAARFIRLEAIAFLAGSLNDICLIALTALSMHRWIIALALAKAVLTMLFDASLVSQLPWSLQLGVTGVAFSNLITTGLLCLLSWWLLRRLGLLAAPSLSSWVKPWLKIASYSGLEAGLRNSVYSLVILRLINQSGAAPLYWNANQLLWGWLLLPVLALGQLIRQDAANSHGRLSSRYKHYVVTLALCIALWFLAQPTWGWLISRLLGAADVAAIQSLLRQLLPFFAVFSCAHLLQNYLYGLGRTDLILQQSAIVNILYYGSAIACIQWSGATPSLNDIVWLFGGGMCLSLLVCFWQLHRCGYFRQLQLPALASSQTPEQA